MHFPDTETGGDFFGFWSREGNPVVQYVLGPGDQTCRTGVSFFQDIDYLKECGGVLNKLFGLEHIGAWHSHHQLGLFNPSSGDVQTMRNALRNQHPSRFLISICNIERRSSVSVGCFLFSRDNPQDYTPCNISVLPGNSPVRDSLRHYNLGNSPLRETGQKLHSRGHRNGPSFTLRNIETTKPTLETGKPHFSENSLWSKKEGHKYLKKIFDKLRDKGSLTSVEIKQLADERPAISFNHYGTIYEIRFPQDFPRSTPEVLVLSRIQNEGRNFWRKKQDDSEGPRIDEVKQIINSLGMLDDDREIRMREQE